MVKSSGVREQDKMIIVTERSGARDNVERFFPRRVPQGPFTFRVSVPIDPLRSSLLSGESHRGEMTAAVVGGCVGIRYAGFSWRRPALDAPRIASRRYFP